MKKRLLILFFLIGLFIICDAIYWFYQQATIPFGENKVIVEIPYNTDAKQISTILYNNGVIRSDLAFYYYVVFTNSGRDLKAGEYEFQSPLTITEIVDILKEGKVHLHKITIPEGLTYRQIAKIYEKNMGLDYRKIIELCEDEAFLKNLGVPWHTAEGYLLAETYFFEKDADESKVVSTMIKKFFETIEKQDINKQTSKLNLTLHEVVTLASIVEKEAKVDEERNIIAAVFLNRLKRGMLLQSCATVNYIIGYNKPYLTYDDLKVESRYNTYIYKGLPPAPICNPGMKSIKAVIHPANVDYLYFVAKGDGTHHFSTTEAAHIYAKNKYRHK